MNERKIERNSRGSRHFEPLNWHSADPESLLQRIEDANIVGMGGSGFRTSVKIQAAVQQPERTVIANGVDSEPEVQVNATMLEHYCDEIVAGLGIVGRILDSDRLHVAVNNERLYDDLQSRIDSNVSLWQQQEDLLSGEERSIVRAVCGLEIASEQYPASDGIVVLNVATLFAIYEAVEHGICPADRLVSVFGKSRWCSFGMRIESLRADTRSIRIGGPHSGYVAGPERHVEATTYAVSEDIYRSPDPCIQCGRCTSACPAAILVESLVQATKTGHEDVVSRLGVDRCIECGACSYVCPSTIPVLDLVRQAKLRCLQSTESLDRALAAKSRYLQHVERTQARTESNSNARNARIRQDRSWQ